MAIISKIFLISNLIVLALSIMLNWITYKGAIDFVFRPGYAALEILGFKQDIPNIMLAANYLLVTLIFIFALALASGLSKDWRKPIFIFLTIPLYIIIGGLIRGVNIFIELIISPYNTPAGFRVVSEGLVLLFPSVSRSYGIGFFLYIVSIIMACIIVLLETIHFLQYREF
jgi:hypothetical protein